ncbi:MAG: SIS domain-containing protein, partial [Proteobacteria bacterium]|nr:SIS domain-containing protein [Pseudomonadota bacterium]
MFKEIGKLFFVVLQSLKEWRIFIGYNPRYAPPNSIIIFPSSPEILACGLAGILTIKKDTQRKDKIKDRLSIIFEKVQTNRLERLLSQSISLQEYLGGLGTLMDMEEYILGLKQNSFSLFYHIDKKEELAMVSETMNSFLLREEELIEKNASNFSTSEMEHINKLFEIVKDSVWALDKDLLSNIDRALCLAGGREKSKISKECFRKYKNINFLLNSLDRIEVRGRDSAGIEISFGLKDRKALENILENLKNDGLYNNFLKRLAPGELSDGSICLSGITSKIRPPFLTFIYKKASITGALGENTKYLRNSIRADRILQIFINEEIEPEMFFAHTRWASVGAINEENCHPINNFSLNTDIDTSFEAPVPVKQYPHYGRGNWTIHVALNGDIDNYQTLRSFLEAGETEIIDQRVTTDTKIIPLQIERYLYKGCALKEAFRLALNDFEGSHAIAMQSNLEPGKVFLALRGSGQSLYIGICDNQYIFSSELYGLVELTPYFIKMDGERERIEGNSRTKGEIFILSKDQKNSQRGISAFSYDGPPLVISDEQIQKAEITTRDIDRKSYPHYLLKEILEAPLSAKKTLRGKYHISYDQNGKPEVNFNLGDDILPQKLKDALIQSKINKIFVIGQGTAAVAGLAIAEAFSRYLVGSKINIKAKAASEFSGFFLEENLQSTLVIAVTQSGTTTDTNRAVAMAKERGAYLIAIVNRRQSDITHITDGVFYTSDGRDIEMSVASTKAFYSQIVAGYILALCFAQVLGARSDDFIARELINLEQVPDKMNKVIDIREKIKESSWKMVKKKRYWAVVGSGPNKVAADEIRIKLSELCYKTISSDIVEDKKHIDLSSEPLIIVCAAGNPPQVVEDIAKDTAIFKAHAATVVVVADEGEKRFDNIADSLIFVPESSFPASVILNTLAGHIWGYYAACSINEDGDVFRAFRNKLSLKVGELDKKDESLFEKIGNPGLHKIIKEFSTDFHSRRKQGFFSSLSVKLASDITLLLKYAVGKLPLEDFWEEFKEERTSSSPIDMLDVCLDQAADELSRPIDAIRHQAKTVTVGTSRKEEMLPGILFDFLRELNFSLENLTSNDGFTVRRIQGAISDIRGYTLYEVGNLDDEGKPGELSAISIKKRGGISFQMKSRAEKSGFLKGTKKTIVKTGDIYAGLGRFDRAPVVIIPLLGKKHFIKNILLVHVNFKKDLTASEKNKV